MPSIPISQLNGILMTIRIVLLILFLPICFLMLFCAIYSTYLTVETWDCRPLDSLNNYSLSNGPTDVKCYTILDSISGQLSKYITERKILLIVRTVSLINTLSTYISAWIAIYRMSFLPIIWLAIVSMASFFITLNFSIVFGPLTGINNFELVPLFMGLDLHPLLVTSVVMALDLLIAVISISLVMKCYHKRSYP